MPRFSYVNGRYLPHHQAHVHIEDRGFQFADSVYEVIAFINGRFADMVGHLDRLDRSLSELQIVWPMPRHVFEKVILEFVRRNRLKNAAVYIQVTRGVAPRDFKFPSDIHSTLVMTIRPANFNLELRRQQLRKAITTPDLRWKRRDIKSTGLLGQVLAKQKALDAGAYEALMVDDAGYITEGSSTNAWIVDKNNQLITRPTAHNMILKGVTRNALQALCDRNGIKIIEKAFTPTDVYQAKEVFTTAAVSLVTPIVEVDGRIISDGKLGMITSQLMDIYMAYATDPVIPQKKWRPE